MVWWPLGRDRRALAPGPVSSAPAPPGSSRRGATGVSGPPSWSDLPPMQRTLADPLAPVAPLDVFVGSLATHRDPSFLAPLSHQVDPAAGGVVEGLADLAPGQPRHYADGAELAVPPTTPATSAPDSAPHVQRRMADGWMSAAAEAAEVWSPGPESVDTLAAETPEPDRVPTLSVEAGPARPKSTAPGRLPPPTPPTPASAPGTPPPALAAPAASGAPLAAPLPVRQRQLAAVPDRTPRTAVVPSLPLLDLPVVPGRPGGDRSRVDSGSRAHESTAPRSPAEPSAPLSGFAAAIGSRATDEAPPPANPLAEGAGDPPAPLVVMRTPAEPTPGGERPAAATMSPERDAPASEVRPTVGARPAYEAVVQRAGRGSMPGRGDASVPPEALEEGAPGASASLRPPAASLPEELPELPVVSRSTSSAGRPTTAGPSRTWNQGGGIGEPAIPSRSLLSAHPPLIPQMEALRAAEVVQRLEFLPVPHLAPSGRAMPRAADPVAAPIGPAPVLQRSAAPARPVLSATSPPARPVHPGAEPIPGGPAASARAAEAGPALGPRPDGADPVDDGPAVPLQDWTEVALPPAGELAVHPTTAVEPSSAAPSAAPHHLGPPVALQRQTSSPLPTPAPGAAPGPTVAPPVVLRQRPSEASGPAFGPARTDGASFSDMFASDMFASDIFASAADTRVRQRAVADPAAAPEAPAPEPTPASAAAPAPAPAASPGGGTGPSATELEEMARRLYEPLSARLRAELWLDRERSGVLL